MNDKFYVSWLFTYWKDEKRASFKTLKISFEQNQSQIFIETPYRNNKLLEDFKPYIQKRTYASLPISPANRIYQDQENCGLEKKLLIYINVQPFYNP
jgi:hypothetical protein